MLSKILSPFRHKGRIDKLLIAVFLLMVFLLVLNAVLHDPYYGYDAHDHINYIESLSANWRLPTRVETGQYYSPPLPYILPAVLVYLQVGLWKAIKLAQLFNALLAFGVLYYLLRICDQISEDNRYLKLASILMLGVLPVFYRSFSLVRGESFLAFLGIYIVYISGWIFVKQHYTIINAVLLGISLGAAILARQWGFFLIPPILVFALWIGRKKDQPSRKPAVIALGGILFAIIVGGWFYALLYQTYGTVTAFDRGPIKLSAARISSLFSVDRTSLALFTDPIRPSLSGHFLPIVYADTWGDYWGYFLVYVRHGNSGEYDDGRLFQDLTRTTPLAVDTTTNRFSINTYLGWVNVLSVIPSLLVLGGLISGLFVLFRFLIRNRSDTGDTFTALITMMVGLTLLGFVWFVLRYQSPVQNGDLIKATYILQVFPLLALLAGVFLERVRAISMKFWVVLVGFVALVFIFNIPAMMTRYILF